MANVSRLPEYPLVVSLVSHERPGDYPTRIELRQVSIELKGWTRLDVAENAEKLEAYSRRHALLVAPQREANQWLGFRNVETQQLERLRRDGFEPAWLVKVGERFDVLLRAPSPLSPEESRQLKNHLTAVYQLTLPREALRDAIRLPGFVAELGKPGTRAELVEAKDRAFSAGERVLTQLRSREEQVHIARWARAQPLSELQLTEPVRALAVYAEQRPKLPAAHPVAQFQERLIAEFYRLRYDPPKLLGSPAEPLRRALDLLQPMLATVVRERTAEAVPLADIHQFTRIARQVGGFRGLQLDAMAANDGEISNLRKEIGAAERAIVRGPTADALGDRTSAILEGFGAEVLRAREKEIEALYPIAQAKLGAELAQAAVVIAPRDERVHVVFRGSVEREAKLRLENGESLRSTPTGTANLQELKAMLASHVAQESEIVVRLKEGSREQLAALVSDWRQNILDRIDLGQKVRYAELGARVEAATLQRDAALFTERDAALSSLTLHLRALADWNAAAPATNARPGTLRAETEALVAVAGGDVSPRALTRLQGELIASTGERAIPLPLKPLTETDALELLRRFASLESEVRKWASEMSGRPAWFDGGAEHLIAKSAALIQVQQAVEKLERRHHGVAEPSPAPDGIAQATWDRAWLKRAEEKGLPQPERHLGNIGPALAPRELAMERAVALKTVEVQAVRLVSKELERGAVLR